MKLVEVHEALWRTCNKKAYNNQRTKGKEEGGASTMQRIRFCTAAATMMHVDLSQVTLTLIGKYKDNGGFVWTLSSFHRSFSGQLA